MHDSGDPSTSAGTESLPLDIQRLFSTMRPRLHRYCARMVGSVIDGEDVVQDALLKAIQALPRTGHIANPAAWLLRIAHNRALDVLRARARAAEIQMEDSVDAIPDPDLIGDRHEVASASLRTFARLPVRQRSCVILMDVLGHSLKEIGEILQISIPAVKANVHRGRAHLKRLSLEHDDRPIPRLSPIENARLLTYVERFNARDFDAIRSMLATEVRVEVVANVALKDRPETGRYFTNYERMVGWRLSPALVDGHPAAVVYLDGDAPDKPSYFIVLKWSDEGLRTIVDFHHARYAIEGAEILQLS
ncbi:RNA polymerase sigma factor [Sinorhizobium numidicum]|uniref:RNA polymerase sigma factor n=1 Tax=Sinorhizobium numidicum TaxID=680248 RepID=A0ABY8CT75_9HYPH|nr:RNA polymerase sigma factor [Sinorhizobium numidicum]WEX73933.1 RNA polymerase sigma factor [Sinorhizobium numidicum]WEX79918.1 RNA polymerase sigma factor [Sinorhizobium numidicum]